MKTIADDRIRLLLKLENIVGSECYNQNIQNWGPNGVFEGEGREFRYPITFIDSEGNKVKRTHTDDTIPATMAMTGYYAFGANQLQIIRALDKVAAHLEQKYNFQV